MLSLFMILFHGKFLGLTMVCIFKNNTEDTFYSLIQDFLLQRSIFYRLYDHGVIVSSGGRHFKLKSCLKTFYTVINSSPV